MLNEKYQDLLKLYENRASKEEDMEIINQLKKVIAEKDEEIRKA